MNKEQTLGALRAFLTSAGTVLATWGFNDGNDWAPVTGIILAVVSLGWGVLWHKSPNTKGTIQWSLVRKLVNAIGSAGLTYGILNPDQVQALAMLVSSLGPVLALVFSVVDNSDDDDSDGLRGVMPLVLLSFLCIFFSSCAGYTFTGDTPYGTVTTDANGNVILAPKPQIVIPTK